VTAAAIAPAPDRPCIALAATFTVDPLVRPLERVLREIDLDLGVEVAPFGQVFQELLDPASRLATNRKGVNVVLARVEDWAGDDAGAADRLAKAVDDFLRALEHRAASTPAPVVVVLCPPSPDRQADPAHRAAAERLARGVAGLPGVRLLSAGALLRTTDEPIHDAEGDRLGRVPYTPYFFAALALSLARVSNALKSPPRKVLVLDCDNTLWKGVVGEDGVQGIEIGAAHKALQRFALAKKREGMLLCLASKNVEADVERVFAERPEMELSLSDVAAHRVNWLPKSQNLHDLAAELNLGIDSFVFIDDNPVECAEVEAACPGALAVCLPVGAAEDDLGRFLDNLWPLDHLDVTDEDQRRTDLYRANQERARSQRAAPSLGEFLAGLELEVTIGEPRPEQRARAAQLTQRTNQFNFTTRRRNERELAQLADEGKACRVVEVSDRFGDYGQVGLLIAGAEGPTLVVDTFLLSCRVLGRGVEHRMIQEAGRMAEAAGLASLTLPFLPTAKNLPARRFAETLTAARREGDPADAGGACYVLSAADARAVDHRPTADADALVEDDAPKAKATAPVRAGADGRTASARWTHVARALADPPALLAVMEREGRRARTLQAAAVAPRTELERRLRDIWADVLRLPDLGVTDDYFAVGGTSLEAVAIFARIARELGRRLPLTAIMESPTVAAFAAALEAPHAGHSLVTLHEGGAAAPLFLVHDADGETLLYRNLARRIGATRSVYALQPLARTDVPIVHTRLEEMAAHYVAEIRKLRPRGPYLLGGLCAGGVVAFEMASQLEAAGHEAHLVAIFDAADVEAAPRPHLESQRQLGSFRRALAEAPLPQIPRVLARKVRGYLDYQVRSRVRRAYDRLAVATLRACLDRGLPLPAWARDVSVRTVYTHAESEYRPKGKLREAIVLFCATQGEGSEEPYRNLFLDPLLGWGPRSAKGAVALDVPGGHGSMLQEPHVADIAEALVARLGAREGER
jgi:FkbH-like protein